MHIGLVSQSGATSISHNREANQKIQTRSDNQVGLFKSTRVSLGPPHAIPVLMHRDTMEVSERCSANCMMLIMLDRISGSNTGLSTYLSQIVCIVWVIVQGQFIKTDRKQVADMLHWWCVNTQQEWKLPSSQSPWEPDHHMVLARHMSVKTWLLVKGYCCLDNVMLVYRHIFSHIVYYLKSVSILLQCYYIC